jgi:hypothetical protein
MTARRTSTRFVVSIAAGMLLAAGAGVAISACSSSTADVRFDVNDAAFDVARDTNRPPTFDAAPEPDAEAGQTQQQCLDACNAKHMASVAKEDAIGTCWDTNCKGPCEDTPATGFDAGEAGLPEAGANPLCGTGAATGSTDCDNCTTALCCPAWSGCFADTDCSALDDCLGTCDSLAP